MSYQKYILSILILGLVACGGVNQKKVSKDNSTAKKDDTSTGQTDNGGGAEEEAMAMTELNGSYSMVINKVSAECPDDDILAKFKALEKKSHAINVSASDAGLQLQAGEALSLGGTLGDRHGNQNVMLTLGGNINIEGISAEINSGSLTMEFAKKAGGGKLKAPSATTAQDETCQNVEIEYTISQGEAASAHTIVMHADAGKGEIYAYRQEQPLQLKNFKEDEGGKYVDVFDASGREVIHEGCTVEAEAEASNSKAGRIVRCDDTQSDRIIEIQTFGPSK